MFFSKLAGSQVRVELNAAAGNATHGTHKACVCLHTSGAIA